MKPAMDAIFLIADNDVRCRGELRRFLSNSGFLVAAVANGLECLAQLVALEPDVLVIAMEIPWGGGDGVIARLNDGLPIRSRPRVLVIGNAPVEALSARSGVAQCNCFPKPLRMFVESSVKQSRIDFRMGFKTVAFGRTIWSNPITLDVTP